MDEIATEENAMLKIAWTMHACQCNSLLRKKLLFKP
jgi:hypothetical protein